MGKIFEWIKDNNLHYVTLGLFASIFSIGRFNIVIFIYIWPFCFLHFLHIHSSKIFPLITISICLLLSNMLRWIGFSNLNIFADLGIGLYLSIVNIIPFIIDDILYGKIPKWVSVFLYPLGVAIFEFIFSFIPLANFNIFANAHRENIQYLQILSLFGCYFLSFVIALFASILDYSINLYKEENKITKFVHSYVLIILAIYFFGLIRLMIPEDKDTLNIACARGISQQLYENGEDWMRPIEDYIEYINKTMKKAKNSNADIIMYAEEAFAIKKENKSLIIEEVSNLTKLYDIFVLLTIDIDHENDRYTNEAILISNNGTLLYNYQKQHLIPIMEKEYFKEKIEVRSQDTDLGKISVAICYDIDFPYYINYLSRDHFDLLLTPSWDWKAIAEMHSNLIRYRAIEGGFNLVKNTFNGIVISNDYKGRTLSYYIEKDLEDYFLISTVNKKGIKTLYSFIGFLFNYLFLLAFIIIIIFAILKNRSDSNGRNDSSVEMKLNIDYED